MSYKFVVFIVMFPLLSIAAAPSKKLRPEGSVMFCESHENQYLECYTDYMIKKANLEFEISKDRCKEDVSWGYSAKYIWVKQDCRASFRVF